MSIISRVSLLIVAALALCNVAFPQHAGSDLCPIAQATHRAVKITGSWQDPATWDHGVPDAHARVYIPCNHTVTNHAETADVQWIHCEGVLKVCDHCNTRINTHTLYVPPHGVVMLGDEDMPVEGHATLEFISGADAGLASNFLPGDFSQLSQGLVCHGMFMAHGKPDKTAWLEVTQEAPTGSTTITPTDLSYQWDIGDEILISGTDSLLGENRKDHVYQSEYRRIAGIDGRTITLDAPLTYRHWPWAAGLKYHVANLTRNVVIRSRSRDSLATRGHLMFMSHQNDMRWVSVEGLGRTDKSSEVTDPRKDASGNWIPGTDANPRGRYADHNHRCGPLNPPSIRQWCVYRDSPGWGLVNHDSNCQWDNCIALDCFGAAFVTEEGQEQGHMRRCLAALNQGQGAYIHSTDDDHGRKLTGDWGADGAGFWLQGGMVEVSDCVSFDNSGRGFAIFNRPLNGYPVYGAGNPMPTHLRYEIAHDRSVLPLIAQYAPLLDAAGYVKAPSSVVPQQAFARNTAYGNKVAVQSWTGPTHNDSSKQMWPLGSRGSITDMTIWGRGGKLHLEYTRQMNVDGLVLVGDRGFRPVWNSLCRVSEAVLLRNPEATVMRWNISGLDGVAAKFRVAGSNDPGGIAAKNIVIEGATINPDGSVTTP